MLGTETILICILIMFVATLVRALIGFGDGLIAMPLLTFAAGLHVAIPVVGLNTLVIATIMLWKNWRHIDFRTAWRLILASFAGIPIGFYGLQNVSENVILTIMGAILVGYGLYKLLSPELSWIVTENSAFGFGFIAGILGGAYNTAGPPIIIFGTLRQWTPEQFRITLQSYFLATGIIIAAGHGLDGMWTKPVLSLFGLIQPAVILAILIGGFVNSWIPKERFARIIYIFLVIIGLVMIF